MKFTFETQEIRDLCSFTEKAIASLGKDTTAKLHARLADLKACQTLLDMPPGFIRTSSSTPMEFYIPLAENCILWFCPAQNYTPKNGSDVVPLSQVDRIKILRIENNNE